MSIIDQQICKALDRMHYELAGYREPCRWRYDGKSDTYSCEHVSIQGKHVIEQVNPYMNQ